MGSLVLRDDFHGWVRLTLNRPDELNAMTDIADDDARFGYTHAGWALTPIWGMSQRLPRRAGIATATRMMSPPR